jgi:hypothetical protein
MSDTATILSITGPRKGIIITSEKENRTSAAAAAAAATARMENFLGRKRESFCGFSALCVSVHQFFVLVGFIVFTVIQRYFFGNGKKQSVGLDQQQSYHSNAI